MASWQEELITRLGPPISLCGVTLSDWRRVLRDNKFAVDAPYLFRAASLTLSALTNSFQAWLEAKLYESRVAKVEIQPPIFVLGHWRSGTTHFQYLLARDRRLATPNTYQVSYPYTFLTTEAILGRLGGILIPKKRPMDDVHMSFQTPNEDEFAVCQMSLCSPYLGFTFPRRQSYYDQFLTLRSASESVIAEWKTALFHFLKKLTWKYQRPIVLKSPPHTCRIRLLLELFPEARFIHIHRDPYTVFQSTCHWLAASGRWFRLQRPEVQRSEDRILGIYREMYDAFFEERTLIPEGQYHEVAFEDLEKDPIGQMRKTYDRLELPDFDVVEPHLLHYVTTLGDYQKNVFADLPSRLRARIASQWQPCFQEWGYPL